MISACMCLRIAESLTGRGAKHKLVDDFHKGELRTHFDLCRGVHRAWAGVALGWSNVEVRKSAREIFDTARAGISGIANPS